MIIYWFLIILLWDHWLCRLKCCLLLIVQSLLLVAQPHISTVLVVVGSTHSTHFACFFDVFFWLYACSVVLAIPVVGVYSTRHFFVLHWSGITGCSLLLRCWKKWWFPWFSHRCLSVKCEFSPIFFWSHSSIVLVHVPSLLVTSCYIQFECHFPRLWIGSAGWLIFFWSYVITLPIKPEPHWHINLQRYWKLPNLPM